MKYSFSLLVLCFLSGCNPKEKTSGAESNAKEFGKGTFGFDYQFIKKFHKDLVLLGHDSAGAQLIVLPAYQGRVMTSTAAGMNGKSNGWVNHDLIASGQVKKHMNAYGGEDRFWLGPEGGQFSIFFKKGVPFTFENWFVPRELDTEPFSLVAASKNEARFEKDMHLENYSGNRFDLKVNRRVRLLSPDSIKSVLGVDIPAGIKMVAFESNNKITNTGSQPWTKSSGLLSIWVLSMLNASDSGVVVIPFKKGDDHDLGKIVTDTYFGKIPGDRLKVKDGIIIFKADAKFRSKLGISPRRALPWLCSYDSQKDMVTLAQFSLSGGSSEYVNSLWELQKEPFAGDAVNAYNDGSAGGGDKLGRFYEIESSSPGGALKPGESLEHWHRIIHLEGSKEELDKILSAAFSLRLNEMNFK